MPSRSAILLPLAIVALACGDGTGTGGDHPAQLRVVSGSGQSGTVSQSLALPFVVEVRGFDTLPLPGVRIDFRVVAGSGSVNPPSAVTGDDGRATTSLVPSNAGVIRVVAAVFSSSMSVPFYASAAGPSSATCSAATARLFTIAQIEAGTGGGGACLGAEGANATYAIVAFNSDTTIGASTAVQLEVSGNVLPSILIDHDTAGRVGTRLLQSARSAGPPTSRNDFVLVEGQNHVFNVNLADPCTNPVDRTARVVAVTSSAIVAADVTNPPAGLTDDEMREIAVRFDTLYNPSDTLNFRAPADMDANGRVILLFTRAVNERASTPATHSTVTFQRRDLSPRQAGVGLPSPCPTSNEGELLYVAVPGVAGRSKTELQAEIPRAIAHTYQHLINASRRLYITKAAQFEEPWLDEALSQIAEELLFHRGASAASRLNLGAFDVALTNETLAAFQAYQRPNLTDYAAFLQSPTSVSPLFTTDSRAARGAGWSLLRYLADRRGGFDFVTWTQLVNSHDTGMRNLLSVFGHQLPEWMRDWAVSVLVDDLFLAPIAYRQLSWNLRSVYSAMGFASFPLNLTPLQTGTTNASILSGGTAYFTIRVSASGAAGLRWRAASGGTPPPLVQWSIVRLQ